MDGERSAQLTSAREISYIRLWRTPMTESPHDVGAHLKARRETRSAQLSDRATGMMAANATSITSVIASSAGRRRARCRRRRCRCAQARRLISTHLLKYSPARYRWAYARSP